MSTTGSLVKRELLPNHIKDNFMDVLKRYGDSGYESILALLKEFPSLIYIRDSEGNTPLHIAAQRRDIRVAELLIEHGGEVNLTNNFGETPLHCAFSPLLLPLISNMEMIILLLDKGADGDRVDIYGNKPGSHIPATVEEVQNERKAKIIEELWAMENNIYSNCLQWFPKETKDDLIKLLPSTNNSARKLTK